MKPFYTDKVLFEATTKELIMMRDAIGKWLDLLYEHEEKSRKEHQQLYNDITHILEQLPF